MGEPDPEATPEERRALFRIVRGGPSVEDVAALTVVLAAASAAGTGSAAAPPDRWSAPGAQHRVPLSTGPGAWHTTYWPR